MSKLEELVAELCPDGVPYYTLGELGKFYGGLTGKTKDDFTEGNAKFITYRNIYSNPAIKLDVTDTVKIAEGEMQRTLEYGDIIFTGSSETPDECGISSVLTVCIDEKLYLNSFCFLFRFDDISIMLPDFAKHLFRSSNLRDQIGKTASGVTRFNVSKQKMEKVVIPVPPLQVQQEIVRILDNFTELTKELARELTKELAARKKQYAYYRDELLTFGDDMPRLPLGKCLEKTNNIKWKQFDGTLEYIDLSSVDRDLHIITQTTSVNQENAPSRAQQIVQTNDVLFGSTRPMLKRSCFVTSEYDAQVCSTGFCVLRANTDKVLPAWIYYMVSTADFYTHVELFQKGASYPAISDADIKRYEIPLPGLAEQEKIVNILSKFEILCNDISTGLPAEIEARTKQYEYYRDKLLTFKERA